MPAEQQVTTQKAAYKIFLQHSTLLALQKSQNVLFFHEAVMNLAYACHQTGCSLWGFPSCIFADSRPDFQRGS